MSKGLFDELVHSYYKFLEHMKPTRPSFELLRI